MISYIWKNRHQEQRVRQSERQTDGRTEKVCGSEVDDEVMCDAAHPAERQNELQHSDVANSWHDKQQNVDTDQRRRLAVSVCVQILTELGNDVFHQQLRVVHVSCRRRLHGAVTDWREAVWRERHLR